jgi:hypothetical protein
VGQEKVKVYISEFYKGLFGAPSKNNFTLVQNSRYSSIILRGNNIITIEFTKKEVCDAIRQMEKIRHLGQMGFQILGSN